MSKTAFFKYLIVLIVAGNLVLAAIVLLGGLAAKKPAPTNLPPNSVRTNRL